MKSYKSSMTNSNNPIITKDSPEVKLAIELVSTVRRKARQELIAEIAYNFCPPLTYRFLGEKLKITKQYIGQLVTKYYPERRES